MPTATLRKVGGSLMFAVPSDFTSQLGLTVGDSLDVELQGRDLVVRAPRRHNPYHYTAEALLAEGDYQKANEEFGQRDWVDAPAVGRELL